MKNTDRGNFTMKRCLLLKIISILTLLVMLPLCMSSCTGSENKSDKLTKEDYVYIDRVYNSLSAWDYSIMDSGQIVPVQKIAFFDFDGTNNICFYTTYSIMSKYQGFYISSDKIEKINPSIYDQDTTIRDQGWSAKVEVEGTDWDCNASKKEKYNIIEKAYKYFLKTNIYDDTK